MNYREARKKANLTIEEVAARTGYAIGTISELETKGEGGARLRAALVELYYSRGISESENELRETAAPYGADRGNDRLEAAHDELLSELAQLRVQLNKVDLAAQKLRPKLTAAQQVALAAASSSKNRDLDAIVEAAERVAGVRHPKTK